MNNNKTSRFVPPTVEEIASPVVESKKGKVSGCFELNIRSGPSKTESVKCKIRSGAEVSLDEEESTDAFYKVCTESGVEGYCMKEYITVL